MPLCKLSAALFLDKCQPATAVAFAARRNELGVSIL